MNKITDPNHPKVLEAIADIKERSFGIGDHIWFNQNWVGPSAGTITAFKTTEATPNKASEPYAEIHLDDGGTTGALLTDIYASQEALLDANKKATAARIAGYKAKMSDVEGLIRFMFDNNISSGACEYTDWDARQAVKERAKELLDIDLD